MPRSSRVGWMLGMMALLAVAAASVSRAEDPNGIEGESIAEASDGGLAADKLRIEIEASSPEPPEDLIVCSFTSGSPYLSRAGELRLKLLKDGGNEASEAAVARALAWIVAHQQADGGWNFDLTQKPCEGECSAAGTLSCRSLATALALLPLLGAGNTHKQGDYQKPIKAGLYFLCKSIKVDKHGGSFRDEAAGSYADALSSVALCEAYALSYDKGLMAPAQASLNGLVHQQDAVRGGWRTHPTSPWQTPLTVWHLTALKAGHAAYLIVPPPTMKRATTYLDSVQSAGGAAYGFQQPGNNRLSTAAGLWGRMLLGWKQDHPQLAQGVAQLDAWGPSEHHMLYNLFAHQVQRHYQGDNWPAWNAKLRDHLLATQDQSPGHQRGSWHFAGDDPGNHWGGRLYSTALATLILETYYRQNRLYAPIYPPSKNKADDLLH